MSSTLPRRACLSVIAKLMIAGLAIAACRSDVQPSGQMPATTPPLACGTGRFDSVEGLSSILLQGNDWPENAARSGPSPVELEDFGDDYFRRTVDESRILGGYITVAATGGSLEGGEGEIISSIVLAFADQGAASELFAHPDRGDPSLERHVAGRKLGDESEALYFEVDGSPMLSGYVLQFRTGHVLAMVVYTGVEVDVSFEETERLALLVCTRLRDLVLDE